MHGTGAVRRDRCRRRAQRAGRGRLPGQGGARTLVCEAQEVVEGAAVTERPFGPDYKVTSLSYVVSLMPQGIVRDLDLHRHGYKVYPRAPTSPPRPRRCSSSSTTRSGARGDRASSPRRRRRGALGRLDGRPGRRARAAAVGRPTQVGSATRPTWPSRPGWSAAARPRHPQGGRRHPAVHPEHRRPAGGVLRDRPSSRPSTPSAASSAPWADPGTAYVMAHHHIGDVGDGHLGSWGFAEGGMGGVTAAMAAAARSFGAEIRTSAPVRHLSHRPGRPGHRGGPGGRPGADRRRGGSRHPPRITFLEQVDRAELPDDFVTDIERWKTRSGTVKVNLAVDRLPRFTLPARVRPRDPRRHHRPGRVAGRHGGRLPGAAAGRPSAVPFADVCIPSVFDKTLAPGATTSSRCSPSGCRTPGPASRWTRSWRPTPTGWWPGWSGSPRVHRLDPVPPGDRPLPDGARVRAGRREHLPRRAVGQPAVPHPPGRRLRRLPHPVRGLYQAGSATHGGGGVTGIPGRNVVRQIEKDRRKDERRQKVRDRLRLPARWAGPRFPGGGDGHGRSRARPCPRPTT